MSLDSEHTSRLTAQRNGITFLDCLVETIYHPGFIANYDRLCGTNLSAQGTNLDHMIDQATGRYQAEFEGLVEFVWEYVFLRFGASK